MAVYSDDDDDSFVSDQSYDSEQEDEELDLMIEQVESKIPRDKLSKIPVSEIRNLLLSNDFKVNSVVSKLNAKYHFKTEDKERIKPIPSPIPPKDKKLIKTTNQLKQLSLKAPLEITKPHKSFIIMGHIDSGKSTIMGRLLYDIGKISTNALNKLIRESTKIGKASFALAWILDENSQERLRGVTIDINLFNFSTAKNDFTLIDSPGHNDYFPQLISGVTQADFGIISVDCSPNNFESSFSAGQFPKLVSLCKCLELNKLIVLINKLDLVDYDKERYEYIINEIEEFLRKISFAPEIWFIPVVGMTGLNIVNKSTEIREFDWYRGPTLLNLLDSIPSDNPTTISQVEKSNFVLSINDVYQQDSFVVVRGKVISGLVEPKDQITILPSKYSTKVSKISNIDDSETQNFAYAKDNVLLKFPKFDFANENIRIGDLLVSQVIKLPIHISSSFTIDLELFQMKKPLLVGTPFVMFRDNLEAPAKIREIISIGDKKTNRKHLASNSKSVVVIEVPDEIPTCLFSDNNVLGRIILRKDSEVIGFGKITDIPKTN